MPRSREFTRQMWNSSRAQTVWAPRIAHAADAWLRFELQSVERKLRPAALVFGLPLVRSFDLDYVEVAPDRFAVGPHASELANAYTANDNDRVGRLLGFPACCRAFFERTWAQGTEDTTWQMARPTEGPDECNILARWLGIRWVFHLPCSFRCEETRQLGLLHKTYMHDLTARLTIDEVLSWPVEWSALHGAAEIRYPVLKVVTSTGYTREKRIVQRQGTSYPIEGARGLVFPYTKSTIPTPRDNGFPTAVAQDTAHQMVLNALRTSPPKGVVLDLGAGNGLLMRRIADTFLRPVLGIEIDKQKAAKDARIMLGDLATTDLPSVDTVVVSQRRFEEIPTLRARVHARQLLVYSYDDPQFARIESLEL